MQFVSIKNLKKEKKTIWQGKSVNEIKGKSFHNSQGNFVEHRRRNP